MKKGSFELGGSDPFIVLEKADLNLAVEKAIIGRMGCNGQACINAKRFIIHEKVYNEFKQQLIEKVGNLTIGDPMDPNINVGPLAVKHLF